jgi:hypothetical protein
VFWKIGGYGKKLLSQAAPSDLYFICLLLQCVRNFQLQLSTIHKTRQTIGAGPCGSFIRAANSRFFFLLCLVCPWWFTLIYWSLGLNYIFTVPKHCNLRISIKYKNGGPAHIKSKTFRQSAEPSVQKSSSLFPCHSAAPPPSSASPSQRISTRVIKEFTVSEYIFIKNHYHRNKSSPVGLTLSWVNTIFISITFFALRFILILFPLGRLSIPIIFYNILSVLFLFWKFKSRHIPSTYQLLNTWTNLYEAQHTHIQQQQQQQQ